MKTLRNEMARFRKSFERQNFDPRDIRASLTLGRMILSLDRLIFPNSTHGLSFFTRKKRLDYQAAFCAAYKRHSEHYVVNVFDLWNMIGSEPGTLFLKEIGGRVGHMAKKRHAPVPMHHKFFMIAAHEVRHRVQHHCKNVRTFNAWNFKKARSPAARLAGRYAQGYVHWQRKMMRKKGIPSKEIRKATNSNEFDSHVIEGLVSRRFKDVKRRKKLKMLLLADINSVL